ncbi:MAG TPA: ATP-binding protein [Gemmatimonadaceae bacterium]|jgi:PAS domain S-box-containing protein|nr:ATP-binding protein [Gemmatimonadaceae bacterium]
MAISDDETRHAHEHPRPVTVDRSMTPDRPDGARLADGRAPESTDGCAEAAWAPSACADGNGAVSSDASAAYRVQVERLVRRLSETEDAIQALAAGEIDAVVDPATAAPIFLSRAQDALARSEARYRDLVTRAPLIVAELSPAGDILFANDAVRTILGHPADTIQRPGWMDALVGPDHRADAEKLLRRLRRGDVTGIELPLRAADGGVRWIAWNSANRYDERRNLTAIVLFGVDITARRGAEDAARQLAEEQVARARAEVANATKAQFLATMSHELRTPLNAIGGYAELLEMGLRGPVTPAQAEDLGKIRRSQVHLLGLINDIMNFARLEAGHVTFQLAAVSVHEILETIRSLTEPQIAAKGVTCHIDEGPPGVAVWADREKVQQVLANLVSNAIKFTDPGGRITVECFARDKHVALRVTDTGVGIPAEQLEVIFEPFVQINRELKRPQDGVGLGLAISRDLALAMRGELVVESTSGEGSAFTLTLPRA